MADKEERPLTADDNNTEIPIIDLLRASVWNKPDVKRQAKSKSDDADKK